MLQGLTYSVQEKDSSLGKRACGIHSDFEKAFDRFYNRKGPLWIPGSSNSFRNRSWNERVFLCLEKFSQK